jgi:pantetheine-phosphate adenylyltransferase
LSSRSARIAVYPASFDPITLGHLDVASRAAAIFDQVTLAVYDRPMKTLLFSTEERLALAREAVADLPNVRVDTYAELTVTYALKIGASVIVRGLRTVSDFERELSLAQLYRGMEPGIEVICLVTSPQYSFVSSSSVREIAELGGPIDDMVQPHVAQALERKYGPRRAQ